MLARSFEGAPAAATADPSAKADPQPSIDDLDRAIVNLAARINAATHDFLVLVRRFDERAGWLRWSCENCAEWLHYRCDISKSAAREKVRVAHALKTLPAIGMAFAKGALSYSKVRALTRVANRDNEEALLAFALTITAANVEERCRELRCGTVASTDDAVRAHSRRLLSLRRDLERGTVTITVELPLETGELIDKALDRALEATALSGPELAQESWTAQRADALVALAKAYLSGNADGASGGGTPDHYQVVVHVDAAALESGQGRAGLPIETVRRLSCDGDRVILIENEEGEPLSIGRKSRIVPAAIRRAVWARDRHCRFPGCARTRFVDIHHILHWSTGGETSLDKLMLLCGSHHRLLHEGRFTIEQDYRGDWFFRRPDGRAIPACGYRPKDMTDDDVGTVEAYCHAHASAEACPSANASAGIRPSAEGFPTAQPSAEGFPTAQPSAEAWSVREPSAEVYRVFRTFAEVFPTGRPSAEAGSVREPSAEVHRLSRAAPEKIPPGRPSAEVYRVGRFRGGIPHDVAPPRKRRSQGILPGGFRPVTLPRRRATGA